MVNNIVITLGIDGYWTYHGNHFITYANVKSLCHTLETNIILYINHIFLKKARGKITKIVTSSCIRSIWGDWEEGK